MKQFLQLSTVLGWFLRRRPQNSVPGKMLHSQVNIETRNWKQYILFFFTLPKIVISIYNKAAKKKKNKMMHGTIFYFQQDICTEEL